MFSTQATLVQASYRPSADLASLNSTAACCIVRTILNWQNINSDPTWASVDNWYWRSWEVCIGITAACIPALRPGYRTVSAGITSYISRRSSHGTSDVGLVKGRNPSDAAKADAAQAASSEADRAKRYGVGEDGFAMNCLPGDKKTADEGIKKTTRIDVEGTSASRNGSQRSLELGDVEKGYGSKDFV